MTFIEILFYAVAWIASGAIGSYLVVEFMWRRGRGAHNVDVDDLVFCTLMAVVFGPFNLVAGVFGAVWNLIKNFGYDGSRVIFKARRK